MDILRAELARRAGGEATGGEEIVDHLAQVLGDSARSDHGLGRFLRVEPSRVDEHRRLVEQVIADVGDLRRQRPLRRRAARVARPARGLRARRVRGPAPGAAGDGRADHRGRRAATRAARPPSTTCWQSAERPSAAARRGRPLRLRRGPPPRQPGGPRRRRHPGAGLGDPDVPVFPRSSNKPLQAVGMLEAGLDLDGELLALACGEPLRRGLPPRRGAPHPRVLRALASATCRRRPTARSTRSRRSRTSPPAAHPQPLVMNCSGKHAAMLATCVANDWPTDSYRDRRPPAAAGAAGDGRAAGRREGRGRRCRRLRRTAVRAVPDRAGPGLRRRRDRARRARRSTGWRPRSAGTRSGWAAPAAT